MSKDELWGADSCEWYRDYIGMFHFHVRSGVFGLASQDACQLY